MKDIKNSTNEFSFQLKPSKHGIGVFVLHDVAEGTKLMVQPDGYIARILNKEDIPDELLMYCEARTENDGTYFCPQDFSAMELSWFINHSNTPNVKLEFSETKYATVTHYAARDLKAGEELLIDYNEFEEPEESKGGYYESL